MVIIETIATVAEDGTITAEAPSYVPRGKHKVVIILEDATAPIRGSGGFPDMASFREQLGASAHTGNTVVEMREDERS